MVVPSKHGSFKTFLSERALSGTAATLCDNPNEDENGLQHLGSTFGRIMESDDRIKRLVQLAEEGFWRWRSFKTHFS